MGTETIKDWFEDVFSTWGDKTALVFLREGRAETELTYGELDIFAFRQPFAHGIAADGFDLRALRVIERFPGLFVNHQFKECGLLMPAGEIVMFGRLIETKVKIDGRH